MHYASVIVANIVVGYCVFVVLIEVAFFALK